MNSSVSYDVPFTYTTPIQQRQEQQSHAGMHTSSAYNLLSTYTSPRQSRKPNGHTYSAKCLSTSPSRIDYDNQTAYGESMRHGHPDIGVGEKIYSPKTHTYLTKSALNNRAPPKRRDKPNNRQLMHHPDYSESNNLVAAAQLIDTVHQELDFVRADSNKKSQTIASVNEALRISLKRQNEQDKRIHDLENQVRMYSESKHSVKRMEDVLLQNAESFKRAQVEINHLQAANNLLMQRLSQFDESYKRCMETNEQLELDNNHLRSKIEGLEKWGKLLEDARKTSQVDKNEAIRDLRQAELAVAEIRSECAKKVAEANVACTVANQTITEIKMGRIQAESKTTTKQ